MITNRIRPFNYLKNTLVSVLLTVACGLAGYDVAGQVDRYPANVTPVLNAPVSPYISDYIETGSQRFIGNIVFNDFNESSWTFKLKLTVEGSNVSLQSKPGFTPTTPITVMPGELYQFSGSDWTEYFNFANLNIKGDANAIVNTGRLPEGMYSFCLQVLDYDTGDPLSDEICMNSWIQLMDPPRVISPACNKIINPITEVQFPFTWQSFSTVNPNGSQVEYQLTVWELLEVGANPLNAVANGQTLQVYQSDPVTNTTVFYGPSQPLLDIGKTYIYQIQAIDQEGKSYYKNAGKSEFCYFHYGYPTGGKIELLFPEKDAGFRRGQVPRVKWSSPNNMVPGQGVNYELVIKEMAESEDPEEAILANEMFFYRKTGEISSPNSQPHSLTELDIEQRYAWQVKAFSSDVEVATSGVSTFFGPSLVEVFYAGNSKVLVDYISNKELENLSGGGRVLLSDNSDDWREVTFDNLVLSESDGYYFLEAGTIYCPVKPRTYPLAPRFEENGSGAFVYDKFKFDKNGIQVEGQFVWDVPFVVEEGSPTQIKTEKKWLEFNSYKLFGHANLEETEYELFDPSGFTLNLSNSSQVFINQDKFKFSLNGSLATPESVRSNVDKRAEWAFTDAEQVGIIQTYQTQPIMAMANAGIEVHPLSSILDLSDNESPGKQSNDPYWKGIYIQEAKFKLPQGFDEDDQLTLDATLEETIDHTATAETEMWVNVLGLNLKTTLDLSGSEAYFNTFPAEYESLTLDIGNQNVNANSTLQGNIFIPFVSQDEPFNFEVQLFNEGFRPGSIQNLTGTGFTHNADAEELALNVFIKKAEIVDKERLQMTLDIEWPSLDISFVGVPNFTAWGNYSVGFFTPEGIVALSEQIKTTFKTYPVTIDALSAGRNKNYYGFAISGKVVMGDDVSGDDGAPAFNLYSLEENGLIDADYEPAQVDKAVDLGGAEDALAQLEDELAALEEDLNQKLKAEEEALENATADAISSAAAAMGGQEYEASEMFNEQPEEEEPSFANVKEELIKYLTTLKTFTENPEAIDELIAKIQESDEDMNSLSDIVTQLKKFASDYAVQFVAEKIGDKFLAKVDKVTNDINGEIRKQANQLTQTVKTQVENGIGLIVDNAAQQAVNALSGSAPELAEVVDQIAINTKAAIVAEITNAVGRSVNDNVVNPVTGFVTANLSDRAHRLVTNTAQSVVMGALGADRDPAAIMDEVIDGIEEELKGLGSEVAGQVDLNKMLEAIKKVGADAINNIDPKRVTKRIVDGAKEAIGTYAVQKGVEAANEFANDMLSDQLGVDVSVDFAGAGQAILSGDPKQLLFDPIPVKVRSPVLDINGYVQFMKDHPIYGSGFAGDVTAVVKKPSTFEVQVVYLNGRKEGLSFWMIEVGGAATGGGGSSGEGGSEVADVGTEMSGNMKEPPSGLKIGPLEIQALRGRVYKNMSAEGLGKLEPDANTKFGAYLHMIMFGPDSGYKMRAEIEASMSTFATGDYQFSFDGNAQFMSMNPQVHKPDEEATILAELSIKYNSAESHFFGYARAVVQKPGVLCAEGSLLVDVKPGAWRVAIGSKEEKVRFIVLCAGFGPTGWLDMNQNTVNLGLGLEISFRASVNVDVKVAKVGILVEAGAAAGINALIQYKPTFLIMEAGVWLELWAKVALSYQMKFPKIKGSMTLAELYVAADATMRFHPAPTMLYGRVQGKVQVTLFKFDFDKPFEMNM